MTPFLELTNHEAIQASGYYLDYVHFYVKKRTDHGDRQLDECIFQTVKNDKIPDSTYFVTGPPQSRRLSFLVPNDTGISLQEFAGALRISKQLHNFQ